MTFFKGLLVLPPNPLKGTYGVYNLHAVGHLVRREPFPIFFQDVRRTGWDVPSGEGCPQDGLGYFLFHEIVPPIFLLHPLPISYFQLLT